MILLSQQSLVSLQYLGMVLLFITIVVFVIFYRIKNNSSADLSPDDFFDNCKDIILDIIRVNFSQAVKDLLKECGLDGATDFNTFYNKIEKEMISIMREIITNLFESDSKLKKVNNVDGYIYKAIEFVLNTSDLKSTIEARYDSLVDDIAKSAEKYEKEVSKENESFEEGTANVPEYVEEETEDVKEEIETTEEVNESDIEEIMQAYPNVFKNNSKKEIETTEVDIGEIIDRR